MVAIRTETATNDSAQAYETSFSIAAQGSYDAIRYSHFRLQDICSVRTTDLSRTDDNFLLDETIFRSI